MNQVKIDDVIDCGQKLFPVSRSVSLQLRHSRHFAILPDSCDERFTLFFSFTMNYQHLYAYLNTRPMGELHDCMRNIVGLTRKRMGHQKNEEILNEDDAILAANELPVLLQRHRVAQRIWTEEAVLGKFGSQQVSPSDRNETLSRLLLTPKVQNHLTIVNTRIEEELNSNRAERVSEPNMPLSSRRQASSAGTMSPELDSADEEVSNKPSKRARSSLDHSSDLSSNNHESRRADVDARDSALQFVAETPETDQSTPSAEAPTGSRGSKESTRYEKRAQWDETLDAALLDAVNKHKHKGWSAVASAVGCGMSLRQCERRWNRDVGPVQEGLKTGIADWPASEEDRLGKLVAQHPLPPAWNKTLQCMVDRIDWKAIGTALGRAPGACMDKWRSLEHGKMKKGAFTLAEDAYIERRVAEWGDTGIGLWAQLEKEMNRRDSSILARWTRVSMRATNS